MIIVSQDKNIIVNFNNIVSIWINNPLENDEGKFEINVDSDCHYERLGAYKTEQRAKEVLEDIYTHRAIFEYFKFVTRDTKNQITEDFINDDVTFDTYEMPEE